MLLAATRVKPETVGQQMRRRCRSRAGNGARAERHRVGLVAGGGQPVDIPPEGGRVGEPNVRDEHRLGAAQVRVRRHHGLAGALGLVGQRVDKSGHRRLQQRDAAPEIRRKSTDTCSLRDRPGMQTLARVADSRDELALDEGVDVLVPGPRQQRRVGRNGFADLVEAAHDCRDVGRLQHARLGQRFGPGLAARDVVIEEPAVDGERLAVLEDVLIGRGRESPGPQRAHDAASLPLGL